MIENRHRLKTSAFKRPAGEDSLEPKKFFVLSVEGYHTERDYFESLNHYLKEHGKKDVEIHVLKHANDGFSSPEQVYELLSEAKRIRENGFLTPEDRQKLLEEFSEQKIQQILDNDKDVTENERCRFQEIMRQLGIDYEYHRFLSDFRSDYDRFVIVIDRDSRSRSRRKLEILLNECMKKGVLFCITNPCFEFWLFLHFLSLDTDLPADEQQRILENEHVSNTHTYISKKVSELVHGNKRIRRGTFNEIYMLRIWQAIENARKFAQEPHEILDHLGTMVACLLTEIGLPH